ncbi:MAG: hypothetical protein IPN40_10370 [Uliginosibacterium sp.]|nr:hypothetical protein [Uliginosibacterium sp.]
MDDWDQLSKAIESIFYAVKDFDPHQGGAFSPSELCAIIARIDPAYVQLIRIANQYP